MQTFKISLSLSYCTLNLNWFESGLIESIDLSIINFLLKHDEKAQVITQKIIKFIMLQHNLQL